MLGLKAHDTVCLSIKSIVFAQTYIYTGMEVSAALANQNVACENELTISTLGAKTLRLRVTTVLGGAAALFVGEKLKTDVQHGDLPSFL